MNRIKEDGISKVSWIQGSIVNTGLQYQQKSYDIINNLSVGKEQLWVWRGDKAISEIALQAKNRSLHHLQVEASDLISESNTIEAKNISIFVIQEVKGFIGHAGWYAYNREGVMPTGPKEDFPDVLCLDQTINIEANSIKNLWIEFNIPKDTVPGVYRGEIGVSLKGEKERLVFEYQIEVLDALLPDVKDYKFDVEYWHHPYNVAEYYEVTPFSQEHLELLKSHMAFYKTLGGHAITVSIVEEAWGGQTYSKNQVHYPSMIKWIRRAGGTWQFDYTDFDKWVSLNKELGIADEVICYSMMPWNSQISYYDEEKQREECLIATVDDEKTYRKVWIPFLEDFIRHLDEKEWFDSVHMGYDERHNMSVAFEVVEAVKNKEGKTLKKSAAFNDFNGNQKIFDQLASASVGLEEIKKDIKGYKEEVEKRKKQGKKTTMYTATESFPNSFVKSIPVESYWTIMYAGSLGADGYLRWAFDAWVEDPLKDTTHSAFQAGDCFLVYPDRKERSYKTSKGSVRLAKLDEGVRDINKLYLIREASLELEKKVDHLLAQIKSEYEYEIVETPITWAVAGRPSKWITDEAKELMVRDMQIIKSGIRELSRGYINTKLNK